MKLSTILATIATSATLVVTDGSVEICTGSDGSGICSTGTYAPPANTPINCPVVCNTGDFASAKTLSIGDSGYACKCRALAPPRARTALSVHHRWYQANTRSPRTVDAYNDANCGGVATRISASGWTDGSFKSISYNCACQTCG
jgi:hypothetical protein